MAQKVSILDGEVNRNWNLIDSSGDKHLLSLFHDCVTGARAAMLDYEEVPGSAGTTNVFNLVAGRVDIPFCLKKGVQTAKDSGRLSILRRGLTGFSYECELNGRLVLDTTSIVQNAEYEFEVSVPATVDTGSRVSGITWYEVHTVRKADGKGTLVHRRFRDFYALQEQVESLMKGHHLRTSLPRFPGKKSKLWTNHGDASFVEDRRRSLEQYLRTLLQLPHVSTLDSTRAFLGIVGNLREFSVPWEGKEFGATLKSASEVVREGSTAGGGRTSQHGSGTPPVITSVQGNGKAPPGVRPGDRLFKVNGESTELMSLEAAWSSVARATRPVMLHFLGPILRMDSTLAPLPEAFLRRRTTPGLPHPPTGDGGSNGRGGSSPENLNAAYSGGWGLRGMLPARKSQQQQPQQQQQPPGVNGAGKGPGPAGGAIGPFGNGAGAARAGRRLPANSRLFGGGVGDATGAIAGDGGGGVEGEGMGSLFDSWRSHGEAAGPGVVGRGAHAAPGRPVGSRINSGGGVGVGSPKGSSDWVPDFSRGSAAPAAGTAAPGVGLAAARSAAAAEARHSGGLLDGGSTGFPAAGGRGAPYGGSGVGSSSLATTPSWLTAQPNSPPTRRYGAGREDGTGGTSGGDGPGGGRGTIPSPSFCSPGAGAAGFASGGEQRRAAAGFGTAVALEADSTCGGVEEDDEEDDENPFA